MLSQGCLACDPLLFVWDQYLITSDVPNFHDRLIPAIATAILITMRDFLLKCRMVRHHYAAIRRFDERPTLFSRHQRWRMFWKIKPILSLHVNYNLWSFDSFSPISKIESHSITLDPWLIQLKVIPTEGSLNSDTLICSVQVVIGAVLTVIKFRKQLINLNSEWQNGREMKSNIQLDSANVFHPSSLVLVFNVKDNCVRWLIAERSAVVFERVNGPCFLGIDASTRERAANASENRSSWTWTGSSKVSTVTASAHITDDTTNSFANSSGKIFGQSSHSSNFHRGSDA